MKVSSTKPYEQQEIDKRITEGKLVCFGTSDEKAVKQIKQEFGDILTYSSESSSLFRESRKALTTGCAVLIFPPKSDHFFFEFGTTSQSLGKIPVIVMNYDHKMDAYIKLMNGLYEQFRKAFGDRPYFTLGKEKSVRTKIIDKPEQILPALSRIQRSFMQR